jgi:hypothetical protein
MGNVLRNVALAGALVAGAGTMAGCANPELDGVGRSDTYGPGSLLTVNGECDPTTTTVVLDENGDWKGYAVGDISVNNSLYGSPEQNAQDELRIEAVGRVGTSDVTEVVFRNGRYHDGVIEVVDGLPFDETLEAGDEYRVDVEDLAEGDEGHRDLTFEIREGVYKAVITVEPVSTDPIDGVEVTLAQDCKTYAPVAN